MSIKYFYLIVLSVGLSVSASAARVTEFNTSVRALGMGNAFTAVASDLNALFYNPAGIARSQTFNWHVLDVKAGASGLSAYQSIQNAQNSSNFANQIESLYGQAVWLGGGAATGVSSPLFAAAVYQSVDVEMSVDNPAYPMVNVNGVSDFGYAVGAALPFSPFAQAGMGVKWIRRMGANRSFGASDVGTLSPSTILDQLKNQGVGYGLDLGLNFQIPGPMARGLFGIAWKNIGVTSFAADPSTGISPPSEPDNLTVGTAVEFSLPLVKITPAIDFTNLNRGDIQLTEKVNFGVEIGLPLIDIRGGFHQGYYTLGAGFEFGLFHLDLATYGTELGEYAGQKEDRRYLVQLSVDLGFDLGGSSGSRDGSSSSSNSSSGGRRLKQRR